MKLFKTKSIQISLLTMMLSFLFFQQDIFAQEVTIKGSQSLHAYFQGKTQPLRDLTPMPGSSREKTAAKKGNKAQFNPPNFINYRRQPKVNMDALPLGQDPVRQLLTSGDEKNLVEPILVIEGIRQDQGNAGVPDTNGDVSADHYIQIINASFFRVFEKGGTPLTEVLSANTLWSQIGKQSFSDPLIIYDESADRWLISDLANIDEMLYGVSETSDPMGAWNLYSLSTPGFADYPKYGVWPNAYIFTINEGQGVFPVYAINRQQLLAGEAEVDIQRMELPGLNGGFPSATPMDWNSPTAPPTDEAFVVRLNDDAWGNGNGEDLIEVWTLNIDWDTPDNTTINSLELPTAPYDSDGCSVEGGGFSFACVPQPDVNQGIDGIMGIIMNNIKYWNFGTHESAVLTFSVDAGGDMAGIRWMELRRESGGDWAVYQEGTFAPDDDIHRVIGSIAINGKGDIALGYSAVGENKFLSLRYTGRSSTDPLGEMTVDEYEFATGGGTLTTDRHGDYAHMTVDPIDGSFWFTGEYVQETGGYNTKIVNFTLRKDTFDIAPISIDTPADASNLGMDEVVTMKIRNVGLELATNVSVGYIFDDNTPIIEPITIDTLYPDSIYTHTFASTVDMSVIGDYEFKVFTIFDLDQNITNDTLRKVRRKLPRFDAGITGVEGLDGFICDSTQAVVFVFTNIGTDTLTQLTINYQLNGGEMVSVEWTGVLASGASASVDVVLNSLLDGANALNVSTNSPNGVADEVMSNDSYDRDFGVILTGVAVSLEIQFDFFPQETSWQLQNSEGDVLAAGGTYPGQELGSVEESWCLVEDECYTFVIFDAYGDGLTDGQNVGSYSIYDAAGNIFASILNVNFGTEEQNDFCVNIPCFIEIDTDVTAESAANMNDGAILISVESGVSPFTYSIDGGTTIQSDPLFSGLSADEYTVLVTDANGCFYESVVMVGVIVGVNEVEEKHQVTVFPNPSPYGAFRVQVKGLEHGSGTLEVQIVDALGRPVLYQKLAGVNDYYEGILSLRSYPSGVYYIRFMNDEMNKLVKIVRL